MPDACFKIERTWTIINWCTYNPNLPCIEVPNPNPNATVNHPSNLPGPTVSACGTLPPWAPTVVRINPTDPTTTIRFSERMQTATNTNRHQDHDTQYPEGNFPASPVVLRPDAENPLRERNVLWDNVSFRTTCEDLPIFASPRTLVPAEININTCCSGSDGDGCDATVITRDTVSRFGWNAVPSATSGT